MSERLIEIGLDPWIIRDGNYPDFVVGKDMRFALEFSSKDGLTRSEAPASFTPNGVGGYSATGVVRFVARNVWVVEYADVLAYCAEQPPRKLVAGNRVTGIVNLSVDPFEYAESLHSMVGMPPLIYTWRIHEIILETAPFVEAKGPSGHVYFVKDETRIRRRSVSETDAWSGDQDCATYLLQCERLPFPAVHR